jgi:DNA-binding phage protein
MDFAERLREEIKVRGRLAELARSSGVSHVAIRKIALGQTANPGINTVAAIGRALDELEAADAKGEVVR